LRGVDLALAKEFTHAVAEYLEAERLGERSPDLYFNLGVAYGELGQADQEKLSYERALSLEPNDQSALRNLGVLLAEAGEFNLAIPIWERLSDLTPNDAEVFARLGFIYGQKKKYKEAIAAYRRASALMPIGNFFYNIALFQMHLEDYESAVESCRRAIELPHEERSPYADAHVVLGICHLELGDYAESTIVLEKAVKLAPDSVKARFNLAKAYSAISRESDAERELLIAQSLDPQNPVVAEGLKFLREERGS
jgi:tetratricopeptide (TPR) repeat protein